MNLHAPVIIVGAGLSGLYAAWLLERAGLDALVLEARDRVGGRILGVPAAQGGHRYDLGPGWLWPGMNPRAATLADTLGLELYPQHAEGGSLYEPGHGAIQRVPHTWATEPASMRIAGGMPSLVEALHASLRHGRVRLGAPVVALALGAESVTVTLASGEQLGTGTVISTLPPRLLAETIRLAPSPEAAWLDARRATPTWMAGHAKLVVTYDTPFWRGDGLSGTAMSQRGPLAEIHDASDASGVHAALFGFVGMAVNVRRQLGREALVKASIAQLTRLFGAAAQTPGAVHLMDWADEAATATSRDAIPLAGHPEYYPPDIPAPWQGRLWLAGSECSPQLGGYVEGALAAAQAVTEAMAC